MAELVEVNETKEWGTPEWASYEWIVLRYTSGSWQFVGSVFGGLVGIDDEPEPLDNPTLCHRGAPADILAFTGACDNPSP
ncbi:MAG: hypothetical protein IRY85_15060 [Micromonosporaceae bacterium]|nr:hypothetical protein [Micromonosporaceae bacterium]